MFSPTTRKTDTVNPQLLAKTLNSVTNVIVDEREVKEAIVVVFDTSNSMDGAGFAGNCKFMF